MAEDPTKEETREPRGFGEHTRGLAGEYAHEQGWGLSEDERTFQPKEPQDIDGGADYEYGARDFGDEPVNTAIEHDVPAGSAAEPGPVRTAGQAMSSQEGETEKGNG